jgi:hypothetical protein
LSFAFAARVFFNVVPPELAINDKHTLLGKHLPTAHLQQQSFNTLLRF